MSKLTWAQVAAFRLQRHHLARRKTSDPIAICRDVCGVQAQVMGCAHLALLARSHQISREAIHTALWQQRSLVRTSAMRQTLHLLPAADYHLYITALKTSRMSALMRIMDRIGVTQKEVDAMNAAIMDILSGDEPAPQRELAEKIKPCMSKNIQTWMKLSGIPLRPAIVAGLICYGPERGREITFVRVDCWLPKPDRVEEMEAKQILLRRYLRAYGPATVRDFSFWSGISMKEAKPVWEAVLKELAEVSIEGARAWLLRDDLSQLGRSQTQGPVVRLLPSFDPYMLAHAEKAHLIRQSDYKRVYRNQGWLSPVILVDGRVVGIWAFEQRGGKRLVKTELLEKISPAIASEIEREADQLVTW